jgi:hypothetical protein
MPDLRALGGLTKNKQSNKLESSKAELVNLSLKRLIVFFLSYKVKGLLSTPLDRQQLEPFQLTTL